MKNYLEQLKDAKKASRELKIASVTKRNRFLHILAELIIEKSSLIIAENQKDLNATTHLNSAMTKRLKMDEVTIGSMVKALKDLSEMDDPIGEMENIKRMTNGMQVGKMRTPIGLILFVYESRPNVIIDAAGLCIKSGNALIVRGGKEARYSHAILLKYIQKALLDAGLSESCIQELEDRSYETLQLAVQEEEYLDLVIPRGREDMIKAIKGFARVPVIAHEKGVCHAFIDRSADMDRAVRIIVNGKTSNPSTCNSLEKVLIHQSVASQNIRSLLDELFEAGVEVRGCKQICALDDRCLPASDEDWDQEYLDMVITIKIVGSFEEALAHIELHSSGLSESIITENYSRAQKFLDRVNSACVLVNASTRLADGGTLGLGAELGISTSSIHMRGPMGLKDLTVTKYVVMGNGQIREG